jgi:co-chaperonin GroES (HSP10)
MSKQQVNILSTDFQPKNEYLLVKPEAMVSERTTESGLVIPIKQTSILDRPTSGKVVSLGSDIADIKEGMLVLWPGTDGLDIEFIDGDFILLRYKSIIGSKKE